MLYCCIDKIDLNPNLQEDSSRLQHRVATMESKSRIDSERNEKQMQMRFKTANDQVITVMMIALLVITQETM